MNSFQITFIILLGLAFLFIILGRRTLKKGREEARKYKNNRSYRSQKQRKSKNLPNKFSEQSIIEAAKHYSRRSNVEFAFDTNILIDHPYILSNIASASSIPLIISQQVRYELDRLKDHDEHVGQEARIALRDISNLHKEHKLKIVYYNKKFVEEQGLQTNVADDLIIGSYLERQTHNKEVIFITNDNNSRTTARTVNLTPLELDWNGKKRQKKDQEFRPGYFNKLLAIIFFSLAFGFFNGAMNIQPGQNIALKAFDEIRSEIRESKQKKQAEQLPHLVEDKKYPFLVESEYDDRFQGKEIEDWGYSAIIDLHIDHDRPKIEIVIGTWLDGDIYDKENELHYILETKDGDQLTEDDVVEYLFYSVGSYNNNRGIRLFTVDSSVKFDKITSYEKLEFIFEKDFDLAKHIDGAKLKLKHKVTEETIATIPVKLIKNKK